MKAFSFFLISGAMLVSGLSVFAYGTPDAVTGHIKNPMQYDSNAMMAALATEAGQHVQPSVAGGGAQDTQSIQRWVGDPVADLTKGLGKPSYTSTTANGRLVYDYVQEPQHVGPIPTDQFVISRSGKVAAADISF